MAMEAIRCVKQWKLLPKGYRAKNLQMFSHHHSTGEMNSSTKAQSDICDAITSGQVMMLVCSFGMTFNGP